MPSFVKKVKRILKKLNVKAAVDHSCHPLTININLFKQININQMFDKIQMILMMNATVSNNRILRLNNTDFNKANI